MVSAICRAADKTKCRYHGAVLRLHDVEREMAVYVKEHGVMSNELFEEYARLRNSILEQEREGWTEDDYNREINNTPVQVVKTEEKPGWVNGVPTTESAEVQNGEFFDEVIYTDEDGTQVRMYNAEIGPVPDYPDYIRVQFDGSMSEQDVARVAGVIGYAHKMKLSTQRDGSLEDANEDTPNSIVVPIYAGSFNRTVYKEDIQEFHEHVKHMIIQGSPLRRDNTRLVQGIDNKDAKFVIYYGERD